MFLSKYLDTRHEYRRTGYTLQTCSDFERLALIKLTR
jgi:hypothetical protein